LVDIHLEGREAPPVMLMEETSRSFFTLWGQPQPTPGQKVTLPPCLWRPPTIYEVESDLMPLERMNKARLASKMVNYWRKSVLRTNSCMAGFIIWGGGGDASFISFLF
jgi:hypothetical protein